MRSSKAVSYIFFQIVPGFVLGLCVFVGIILMFQILRLTDLALMHGLDLATLGQLIFYVSISLLPALLPMSLLFAVLMTYGRLSSESEIVAMKAIGVSSAALLMPAVALGTFVGVVSAQVSFQLAPWGNRQFEVLMARIGNNKATAALKSGTFSEGFYDLVVYANEVDSETGRLSRVFIFDERHHPPVAVLAKSGDFLRPKDTGHPSAGLRLKNGEIHRKSDSHLKIKFGEYDISLFNPAVLAEREKSPPSLTLQDLQAAIAKGFSNPDEERTIRAEYHKRWAIAVLCLIFSLVGVGLGTNPNRRAQRAGSAVMSVGVIIGYWVVYVSFEGLARSGSLPVGLAIWTPNLILAVVAYLSLRKIFH